MTFYGNPNVMITAINTSGGIVCSRTSGRTPCFIQVSASAITATGTSVPFEDLSYSWDFGDPSGTEMFANPGVRRGTLNANSDQIGPEAGYVYRSAGTYTVTLTISGNGFAPVTVQATITVTDFSAAPGYSEIYVDSNATSGGNGTIGSPYNSLTDVNTFIASGTNKRVWFKKGSSFSSSPTGGMLEIGGTGSAGGTIDGLQFDVYGSGAAPIFTNSAGAGAVLTSGNGSGSPAPKTNIYIGHLNFVNSSVGSAVGTIFIAFTNATAACSNIYFDDCDISTTVSVTGGNVVTIEAITTIANLTQWGLYNCRVVTPTAPTTEILPIFCEGLQWYLRIGGYVHGGTFHAGGIDDHYEYVTCREHMCFTWIDYSGAAVGSERGYCININGDVISGALVYGGYIGISECGMADSELIHDLSNSTNDPTFFLYKNAVCQLCRIHNIVGANALTFSNAETYTHRYNEVWGTNGGVYIEPDAALNSILTMRLYGNKIYRTVTNVILSCPGFTLPQTVTNETYQCTQPTAGHYDFPLATQAAAGAIFNRNTWWCLGAISSTIQFRDAGVGCSFATVQSAGLDASSVLADPHWVNPGIGDFSVATKTLFRPRIRL